jgi:16S rRNA U516 pseudouridylate synthase RsuA-like enzyme
VRINKCFKNTASRREADRFLAEGRVTINGATATAGDRVVPGDKICLDSKLVRWTTIPGLLAEAAAAATVAKSDSTTAAATDSTAVATTGAGAGFVYLKYYKPVGVTCTTDTADATNILQCSGVDRAYKSQRLFPVGRLDKDSTGLILLTTDGRIPGAVLQPDTHKSKVFTLCTCICTMHNSSHAHDLVCNWIESVASMSREEVVASVRALVATLFMGVCAIMIPTQCVSIFKCAYLSMVPSVYPVIQRYQPAT